MYQFDSSPSVKPQAVVIPDLQDSPDLTRFFYQRRQDRQRQKNAFFKDLSVEDVETIPEELLNMQSQNRQQYYDKWTQKYKASGGKLGEQDLIELAKEKAGMLREQKRWLMSQKNYQNQVAEYGKDPTKWDKSSEEALRSFDPNNPTKQYLTVAYASIPSEIDKAMNLRPANQSTSVETKDAKGNQITTKQDFSNYVTDENVAATMAEDLATREPLKRAVTRDFMSDLGEVQKYINEVDAGGPDAKTKAVADPRYKVAKQFEERYGGQDGLTRYYVDNYKDEYQQYNKKSVSQQLPGKEPSSGETKKKPIKPEEVVFANGEKGTAWPTRTDSKPFNGTPISVYEEVNGELKPGTPVEISGGKIVNVVKRLSHSTKGGTRNSELYAVVQYTGNKKENAAPPDDSKLTDQEKTNKALLNYLSANSKKSLTTIYIPFKELSGELQRKFDYIDIDKNNEQANADMQSKAAKFKK